MTTLFAKTAAVAAIAFAALAMTPAASFAHPFVYGGPGYQPPVHAAAAAPGARAYAAAGRENGAVWMQRATTHDCTLSPASISFEPCNNSR